LHSRKGKKNFLFSTLLILALGPTQCQSSGYRGLYPQGVKRSDTTGQCRSNALGWDTGFRGFPQSIQANSGILPRLFHNCFLPDPFQFISHRTLLHCTIFVLNRLLCKIRKKEIMRPRHQVDRSIRCSGQIKNVWIYTFTPPLVFLVGCLNKHRNNFTSNFFYSDSGLIFTRLPKMGLCNPHAVCVLIYSPFQLTNA
jgi:hypothetical protein